MSLAALPYALPAVLLLALVILVLLLVLLYKSMKAAVIGETPERLPLDFAPEPAPQAADEGLGNVAGVFRHAARSIARHRGDRYELPLYLLAGAESSRPADLLARSGLELDDAAPASELSLGNGRGFTFFREGAVLDIAGPQVLGADGRTSDTAGWSTLVREIQKFRPKRPLDGMVLTLPCGDLVDALTSDVVRAELAARMGRLQQKLGELQQSLGFRLPAYVVLTGCERLPGFTALCENLPEAARREMLGWSNPAPVDAAYRGEAVHEALDALSRRLAEVQMEVFAGEVRRAGEVLQLADAAGALAVPLRIALDQLFRGSTYQTAAMLRGVYLTGEIGFSEFLGVPRSSSASAVYPRSSEERFPVHNAFLADLFEQKIFAESGLAAPNARNVTARHRAVRVAQAVTVATAVVLAGGLMWSYLRLAAARQPLQKTLRQALDDMRKARRNDDGAPAPPSSTAAGELLAAMPGLHADRYWSPFIPSSWVSPIREQLQGAIGVAFAELVLRPMRLRMEEKGRNLINDASTRLLPVHDAPGEVQVAASPRVDDLPEFQQLQRYLLQLRELEVNAGRYNALSRQSGSPADLRALLKYAFDRDLPPHVDLGGALYATALRQTRDDPFQPELLRPLARGTALQLVNGVYTQLFARNALIGDVQQLSLMLQTLVAQPPPRGDTEPFRKLAAQLRRIDLLLSQPGLEWAFAREFALSPAFTAALAEMERSPFLGVAFASGVRESGTANWNGFRRLLIYPAPVIGPIVSTTNGMPDMQLSPDAIALQSGLDTFLGQPFVTNAANVHRLATTVMPDRRMVWDAVLLDQAVGIAQAHERFRTSVLRLFPAELRLSIESVARERAAARMWELVCASQRFESIPAMSEDELSAEVTAFSASQQPLADALDAFARLGYDEPRRDVAATMTAEAARLLQVVDRMLEGEEAYRPRQGSLAWWDGSTPISPTAWDAHDVAELNAYLDATRTRVSTLARTYAQPLLAWLARAGTRDRADIRPLAMKWQAIAQDLADYDAKKPGNTLLTLETYMTSPLTKVRPTDCAPAALPAGFRANRGFFATALQDLSREASTKCEALGGRAASSHWSDLAKFFNDHLAGHYPFADVAAALDGNDADPTDIREFFKRFDKYEAAIRAMPKSGTFAPAQRFVDDMAAVRAFFATFLASPADTPPALDVEATFRILRDREVAADEIIGWSLTIGDQTITDRDKDRKRRWTAGKPVRLALRWASGAAHVPVLPVAPKRGVSVNDRTIVYEYGNRWSLLAALASNAPQAEQLPAYADVQPVTLALTADTRLVPAEEGAPKSKAPVQLSRSQVFLRLALLAPGTSDPVTVPKFPLRAPLLAEEVAP